MVQVINQPFSDRLGNKIIEFLNKSGNERFDKFYILSAFVKKSGLSRIQSAILNFKNNGGVVKAVVGVNQQISSREGLLLLKQLSNESYVYYNRNKNPQISFHPKMYIFEKIDKAVVFIGSSNLTSGGFFTNYELNSMVELDLTQEGERSAFSEYLSIFERYSNTAQPTCKELTNELIEDLDRRRMLGTEQLQRPVTHTVEHEAEEEAEPLFGSESFGMPPPAFAGSATIESEELPVQGGQTFVMTLQQTDVGTGQTTLGTSRRSPEIFIPLVARSGNPDFWGWPMEFIEDPSKPGKFDRRNVRMRFRTRIIEVNMMTWPLKHDFRLRSEILRSSGAINDILKLTKTDGREGIIYDVEIIPQGSADYLSILSRCTNIVRNSRKKYGYY